MRSSSSTLQTHYFKNDVDLMQDEKPEPQQQQKILTEINKNVVETPFKFKDDIINEKSLIKVVEQSLIKQVEKTKI